jgi:short-subunit dehydrogenase involved in D-alanine esterification of teichoic acids
MASNAGNLNFQCAIITGGAGGIGKALAQYFLSKGKKVIIVGRTPSNVEATAKEIGATAHYVLDTGKTADIPAFVDKVTADYPEVDCLVNNAGVQRPIEVLKTETEDFLSMADQEIDINIRGPMHLSLWLLPHFKTKPSALIINVTSVLGFVPFSIVNPGYNGTKAYLHFWSMNLRTQLRQAGAGAEHIKVVELAPPLVESDLHRDRDDPDDNKKHKNAIALTMEEFMREVEGKMEKGEEMVTAGHGNVLVGKWYDTFGERYKQAEGRR